MPTVTVEGRLQLTFTFPEREGADNDRLTQLTPANRRLVRRTLAQTVDGWFPSGVRDDWDAFDLQVDSGGHLPTPDARSASSDRLENDPRITLPDPGLDPNQVTTVYNVHDDVQCTSVRIGVVEKTSGQAVVKTIQVTDPAMPGGQGTIEGVLSTELKWEVPLAEAMAG